MGCYERGTEPPQDTLMPPWGDGAQRRGRTMNGIELVDVNAADGSVVEPDWLARAEAVHRELRPHLPEAYAAKMARVFAGGGRMLLATTAEQVLGLAVYRIIENTAYGLHLYVDDLVTTALHRSSGVGHVLLRYLEARARDRHCHALVLDSGTQRQQAHRFYFREGFTIVSFHFSKPLK